MRGGGEATQGSHREGAGDGPELGTGTQVSPDAARQAQDAPPVQPAVGDPASAGGLD